MLFSLEPDPFPAYAFRSVSPPARRAEVSVQVNIDTKVLRKPDDATARKPMAGTTDTEEEIIHNNNKVSDAVSQGAAMAQFKPDYAAPSAAGAGDEPTVIRRWREATMQHMHASSSPSIYHGAAAPPTQLLGVPQRPQTSLDRYMEERDATRRRQFQAQQLKHPDASWQQFLGPHVGIRRLHLDTTSPERASFSERHRDSVRERDAAWQDVLNVVSSLKREELFESLDDVGRHVASLQTSPWKREELHEYSWEHQTADETDGFGTSPVNFMPSVGCYHTHHHQGRPLVWGSPVHKIAEHTKHPLPYGGEYRDDVTASPPLARVQQRRHSAEVVSHDVCCPCCFHVFDSAQHPVSRLVSASPYRFGSRTSPEEWKDLL